MKRTFLLFLILCLVLLTLPVMTFAAAAAPATDYGGILSSFLRTVVFPIVASIILGLVGLLLNKLRQKYNLSISQQMEDNIDGLVKKGIAYAEEKAAAAVKAGVKKYTGNDKADAAIAFVLSQAPHLPVATIEAKITSWLGLSAGVGASGDNAVGTASATPLLPPMPVSESVASPVAAPAAS